MADPSITVLMTKRVADRWVRSVLNPEYRFKVLYGSRDTRNMADFMYSFRDGRVAMAGVTRVSDLGIKDTSDGLELWSKDRESLLSLHAWYERRGYETTGVW